MTILKQSNIENFKEYSQFKSLKDFNNQFEMWMAEYKHIFTPSEYMALNRLRKFCVKDTVYGVANARINIILEAIEERDFLYGVSRSTFKRMITKAKRIGLLEVKETVRANMSQSSNLYIFQRFNTIELPQTKGEQVEVLETKEIVVEQLNHLETSINFKTSNINNNHLNVNKRNPYIKYVPKSLQHYQQLFGKQVKDIYSRVWLAGKKLGANLDQATMQLVGFKVMEQLKQYIKQGKQLTTEQMNKLAYAIGYNQIKELVGTNDDYQNVSSDYIAFQFI